MSTAGDLILELYKQERRFDIASLALVAIWIPVLAALWALTILRTRSQKSAAVAWLVFALFPLYILAEILYVALQGIDIHYIDLIEQVYHSVASPYVINLNHWSDADFRIDTLFILFDGLASAALVFVAVETGARFLAAGTWAVNRFQTTKKGVRALAGFLALSMLGVIFGWFIQQQIIWTQYFGWVESRLEGEGFRTDYPYSFFRNYDIDHELVAAFHGLVLGVSIFLFVFATLVLLQSRSWDSPVRKGATLLAVTAFLNLFRSVWKFATDVKWVIPASGSPNWSWIVGVFFWQWSMCTILVLLSIIAMRGYGDTRGLTEAAGKRDADEHAMAADVK